MNLEYTEKEIELLQSSIMSATMMPMAEYYNLLFKVAENTKSKELTQKELSLLEGSSVDAIFKIKSIEENFLLMAKCFNILKSGEELI